MGKAGTCHSAYMEAITRLISGWFRSHGELDTIIEELRNITCCPMHSKDAGGRLILSPADAISFVLAKYSDKYKHEIQQDIIDDLQDGDKQRQVTNISINNNIDFICPKCSGKTFRKENCVYCMDEIGCGWSKC